MATITGTSGSDILIGTQYGDNISGLADKDKLLGMAGDDLLFGGEGNDSLDGGAGDDFLIGGPGRDRLNGGAGFDFASYFWSTSGVIVRLNAVAPSQDSEASGDGLENIEGLIGSNFNDKLFGDAGDNILFGAGGIDQLFGLAGDDILSGGAGGDTLDGGAGFDLASYRDATSGVLADLQPQAIVIGPGGPGGHLTPNASITVSPNTGDAAGDIYKNIEGLEGSDYDDRLRGDDRHNKLIGGGGNDILDGRGGADTIEGGIGNDRIRGDSGNDTLFGGKGDDFIVGGLNDDVIDGGEGEDTAKYSGTLADYIISRENGFFIVRDRIAGRDGTDRVFNVETFEFEDGKFLPNAPPEPKPDEAKTYEDTVVSTSPGYLLANDSDPENDPISVTAINGNSSAIGVTVILPSGATLKVEADGSFVYDPRCAFLELHNGASATDQFEYSVSDNFGATSTAHVTIAVLGKDAQWHGKSGLFLASENAQGEMLDRQSYQFGLDTLSSNGSLVAFESAATNTESNLPEPHRHVYIKNVLSDSLTLVTQNNGEPLNGDSSLKGISPDGDFVVFSTNATELSGASEPLALWLKNMATGNIVRVDTNDQGVPANDAGNIGGGPAIVRSTFDLTAGVTPLVFFESNASNLVNNDDDGSDKDVFMKNMGTGEVTLVSTPFTHEGTPYHSGYTNLLDVSTDAQFVVMAAERDDDGPHPDSDFFEFLVVKNMWTGEAWELAEYPSGGPHLSIDGFKMADISNDGKTALVVTKGVYSDTGELQSGFDHERVYVVKMNLDMDSFQFKDLSTFSELSEPGSHDIQADMSDDGRFVVIVDDDNTGSNIRGDLADVYIYDTKLDKLVPAFDLQTNDPLDWQVFDVSISGDGKLITINASFQPEQEDSPNYQIYAVPNEIWCI